MNSQRHCSLPQNPNASDHPSTSFPTYYNSHYLQAYGAQTSPKPIQYSNISPNTDASQTWAGGVGASRRLASNLPRPSSSTWYQPGNQRCTYQSCSFTGSLKSVEVHMMDRHLIYPLGWDKQRRKSDWDADPSLKGKPIPIQGTNVVLDSPEILEAWIAERKKRFPTSSRVEDKKRRMDEAIARGQLDPADLGLRVNKRRKTEGQGASKHDHKNYALGKRTELARVPDSGWSARMKTKDSHATGPTMKPVIYSLWSTPGYDSDDEPPETTSSKTGPTTNSLLDPQETVVIKNKIAKKISAEKLAMESEHQRKPPPIPKMPPRNPFAARPTLLRNLLLPEIRVTVSNLSQAIRFVVDNDFLHDVELRPGQARERNRIEVVRPNQDKKKIGNSD